MNVDSFKMENVVCILLFAKVIIVIFSVRLSCLISVFIIVYLLYSSPDNRQILLIFYYSVHILESCKEWFLMCIYCSTTGCNFKRGSLGLVQIFQSKNKKKCLLGCKQMLNHCQAGNFFICIHCTGHIHK